MSATMMMSTLMRPTAVTRATFSAPKKAGASSRTTVATKNIFATKKVSISITAMRAVDTEAEVQATPAMESAARSMGYDISEGIFGFTPFAELWVGRLAMAGFTVGFAEELWTGEGILAQIGIATPNPILTAILALFFVGGSAAGAAQTLAKAQNGEMSYAMFKRYVEFFGADTDSVAAKLSIDVKKMEARGQFGFLGPDDMAEIAAAKSATPADKVLSMDDRAAAAEAAKMKAQQQFDLDAMGPPPGGVSADRPLSVSAELNYALDTEMTNGRWAMIGFAAAVAIESATGQGIIGQLIFYAKATGLLGADSGF